MSSRNSCISDVKSGAEPEESQICEIVSAAVLLTFVINSALIPNELLILRLKNLDMPRPLRLDVANFAVQLLAGMLSA